MDHHQQAIAVFDKRADDYQEKYMDVSLYSEALEAFRVGTLQSGLEVLDIACGPGNMMKYLSSRQPELQLTGIDLAPSMVRLAKLQVPDASFFVLDCRQISKLTQKFDGILCSFCIPYLDKEEVANLLREITNMVKPAGMLYLSFMTEAYQNSGILTSSKGDEVYTYFYEIDFIREQLKLNGWKICYWDEMGSPNLQQQQRDVVVVARLEDANSAN